MPHKAVNNGYECNYRSICYLGLYLFHVLNDFFNPLIYLEI